MNKNGVEAKKNMTTKKVAKDGRVIEEKIEDYLLSSGVREVVKTVRDWNRVTTKRYELKKGEELFKELANSWAKDEKN